MNHILSSAGFMDPGKASEEVGLRPKNIYSSTNNLMKSSTTVATASSSSAAATSNHQQPNGDNSNEYHKNLLELPTPASLNLSPHTTFLDFDADLYIDNFDKDQDYYLSPVQTGKDNITSINSTLDNNSATPLDSVASNLSSTSTMNASNLEMNSSVASISKSNAYFLNSVAAANNVRVVDGSGDYHINNNKQQNRKSFSAQKSIKVPANLTHMVPNSNVNNNERNGNINFITSSANAFGSNKSTTRYHRRESLFTRPPQHMASQVSSQEANHTNIPNGGSYSGNGSIRDPLTSRRVPRPLSRATISNEREINTDIISPLGRADLQVSGSPLFGVNENEYPRQKHNNRLNKRASSHSMAEKWSKNVAPPTSSTTANTARESQKLFIDEQILNSVPIDYTSSHERSQSSIFVASVDSPFDQEFNIPNPSISHKGGENRSSRSQRRSSQSAVANLNNFAANKNSDNNNHGDDYTFVFDNYLDIIPSDSEGSNRYSSHSNRYSTRQSTSGYSVAEATAAALATISSWDNQQNDNVPLSQVAEDKKMKRASRYKSIIATPSPLAPLPVPPPQISQQSSSSTTPAGIHQPLLNNYGSNTNSSSISSRSTENNTNEKSSGLQRIKKQKSQRDLALEATLAMLNQGAKSRNNSNSQHTIKPAKSTSDLKNQDGSSNHRESIMMNGSNSRASRLNKAMSQANFHGGGGKQSIPIGSILQRSVNGGGGGGRGKGNRFTTSRDSPSTYGYSYKQVLESAMELEYNLSNRPMPEIPAQIMEEYQELVKAKNDKDVNKNGCNGNDDGAAILVPYELPEPYIPPTTTKKGKNKNNNNQNGPGKGSSKESDQVDDDDDDIKVELTPYFGDFDNMIKVPDFDLSTVKPKYPVSYSTTLSKSTSPRHPLNSTTTTPNQSQFSNPNSPYSPRHNRSQSHNHNRITANNNSFRLRTQSINGGEPLSPNSGLINMRYSNTTQSSNGGRIDSLRHAASNAMMRAGLGSAAIRLAQSNKGEGGEGPGNNFIDLEKEKYGGSVRSTMNKQPAHTGNSGNDDGEELFVSNYTNLGSPKSITKSTRSNKNKNSKTGGIEGNSDYYSSEEDDDDDDDLGIGEISKVDEYGFIVQNKPKNSNQGGSHNLHLARKPSQHTQNSTSISALNNALHQFTRPLTRGDKGDRGSGGLSHVYNESYKIQKWRTLMASFEVKTIKNSRKVKKLAQAGFPKYLRGTIYKFLMDIDKYRGQQDDRSMGAYYHKLCEQVRKDGPTGKNIYEVIERDIARCYPEHSMFRRHSGLGQAQLRRILCAYSQHNPEVGYCQGMGRLVGLFLMQGGVEEEEAFWMTASVVDQYLPGYYTPNMETLRVHATVFEMLLRDHNPTLFNHLKSQECVPLMYITPWFMTVFTMALPWPSVLRVWDWFTFRGNKILFRIALAILDIASDHLISRCPTLGEQLQFLLHLPEELFDEDTLIDAALRIKFTSKQVEKYTRLITKDGMPDRGAPNIPKF
ncbi:hypothetical protein H4219_002058 [Mycoemilia scoparia]|uniref:Rab-GAP TBC domain-containing protein n=1 Tax=Mycoemilia scoparia TaxID=417184 RepID=A0A9W8DV93_9FUNG|nr:hypothetical protein H4219_002058 [Mycoemilia scoparia]